MKSGLNLLLIAFIFLFVSATTSCTKESDQGSQNNGTLRDTTILNVSYGLDTYNLYDLYLPEGRDSNTPVVLIIHGGAWKAGQKEDMNSYIKQLRNSWPEAAVVNMNYRLASNAKNIHHNEMMQDIKSVIDHVLSNKEKYQISSKFGVAGASAGGHLAMIYAYKYDITKNIQCVGNFFGPSNLADWSWYNSNNLFLGANVGDVLSEYVGQPWESTLYQGVSPYWTVTASSQPTIIFHGTLDPIVPVQQSQLLKNKLSSLNVPNEYHEYLAFHGFDATQTTDVIAKMVAFFKKHMK